MMAYNPISLFKKAVVKRTQQAQLKTLRCAVFAIGGYITRNGNQRILKLALAMRRRQWISALRDSAQHFNWPSHRRQEPLLLVPNDQSRVNSLRLPEDLGGQ